MSPSLSAALIVRNEEDMLPECLGMLGRFVDEICVVDTGSEDRTLDILKQSGCRMACAAWRDDFSAARNASLGLCRGDWILVMDADERIATADHDRLRGLMAAGPDRCYRFITRNYTNAAHLSEFCAVSRGDETARGFAGWFPSGKVRLFPNGLDAHFEGHVHELVNPSLEARGIAILDSDIPIHHYPLLKPEGALRRKQALYAALGVKKTELTPDDPKVWAELGTQYLEMGEHARAVRAFREAVRRAPDSPVLLKDLGGALHLLGRSEEACAFLELCLKLDPGQFDAWRNLGVAHANRENWARALECFDRALKLSDANADIHRYRGLALAHLGRAEEASRAALEALERQPHSLESRALFTEQMNLLGKDAEAATMLQRFV